jgi:hypothetical protein
MHFSGTIERHTSRKKNMNRYHAFPLTAAVLTISIASAIPAAHAATDYTGQTLTLTPNADESAMLLSWIPATDEFGPAPTCGQKPYSLALSIDGTVVQTFNQQNSPLANNTSGTGRCILQKTIFPSAWYAVAISPGVWSATAENPVGIEITESRAINACTPLQGKQSMYRTKHSSYTDNFYTTSASQRDSTLRLGYAYRGVPFSMPYQAQYGSAPFYRFFKGAPQLEHFYTASTYESQYVQRSGYSYEGIEGYLFTNFKPNTVPLRRYAYFDGSTGDLMHHYTISSNDPETYGWSYDGIVGYVCTP